MNTLMYGLPSLRAFPLDTPEEIQHAVRFFAFCPVGKRNELSRNINQQAIKLQTKINVHEDMSFHSYVNKFVLSESDYLQHQIKVLAETGMKEVGKLVTSIKDDAGAFVALAIKPLFILPDLQKFLDVERRVAEAIITGKIDTSGQYIGNVHFINPYSIINDVFSRSYEMILEFVKYNTPDVDLETNDLMNCVLKDLFSMILTAIKHEDTKEVKRCLSILTDLYKHYSCNLYQLVRMLKELEAEVIIADRTVNGSAEFPIIRRELLKVCEDVWCSSEQSTTIHMEQVNQVLQGRNINLLNTENYLKTLKMELDGQLRASFISEETKYFSPTMDTQDFFLSNIDNTEIRKVLMLMEGEVNVENIKRYDKNLCIHIDGCDIMQFRELGVINQLYTAQDKNKELIYYGINESQLYLLMKKKDTGELVLAKVYDTDEPNTYYNFICPDYEIDKDIKLQVRRFALKKAEEEDVLTEGIQITPDGSIKFNFKPKNSFMDEYAEIHKVLNQDYKTGNYEGMKVNLALMFDLISRIEKKIIYTKKTIKTEKKRDGEKARTFAINDFKTYLKHLQKAQPNFNFTDYYQNSDIGNIIFTVTPDTVKGLKRLFQSIILR